jgi:hypothetical protein
MRLGKRFTRAGKFLVVCAVGMMSLLCAAQFVRAMDCSVSAFQGLGLTDEKFGKPVSFTSAAIVPAASGVPEYCDVVGVMFPEIGFEVGLPTTTWNQRLLMAGNGGKAGSISKGTPAGSLLPSGNIIGGMKLGYAATSTDTGHTASKYPGSTFAYVDYPTAGANVWWYQRLEDFAYRAVHETIAVSKKMVKAYYGKPQLYAYWVGCSTGGRQGLMEAQRYPNDFDGISAGAAVNSYMAQQMSGPEQLSPQVPAGSQIPLAKLPMLGAAVYSKCDGIDSLVDGLIDDPLKCNFDPDKDLVKCPGDVDASDCFTKAQIAALKGIYAGGYNSKGKLVVAGTQKGAEAFVGGWNGWLVGATLQGTQKYGVVADAFNYLMFETPRPTFQFLTDWNWDTDPPLTTVRGDMLDATNPDLWGFWAHRGKLLIYHGWADVSSNPSANSLPYYQRVVQYMGDRANDSVAYYFVPGMGHCSGGIGCDKVDWLTPLVNWVEKGTQPGAIIGASSSGTPRTRPMCRYPEVARYSGSGSIDDAANFVCVPPIDVTIDPKMISLSRTDMFTAYITMPKGFQPYEWGIRDATCDGASAVGAYIPESIHGRTYAATFRTRDLVGVTKGAAVSFTVKLTFNREGKTAQTQASTTIQVID